MSMKCVKFNVTSVFKYIFSFLFYISCFFLQGNSVSIQLWDIGGQTIGGKMIENYLSGAQVLGTC